MTEIEAIEMLRAYHKCQSLQVKGIYEDCNNNLCDKCVLCFAKGNNVEHIKSIEIAIEALEKQIPKKVVKNDKCPICGANVETDCGDDMLDYRLNYCDNCGQKLD